ncbi:MAG: hydroxylamine reductase [Candidatus Omnitrophica bacterium]|nr:hydroxylamine reductase [Candidatus Omnitrophota bacterium]MDD5574634.1 hydroxylamine reductase [Candidatus Omnitrophota bacterium]
MFCYQCEQTANGAGCTVKGVCGKNEDIASLQDTLIFGLKGIGAYAYHARELGAKDDDVDAFMHEAMFATLTNVDFDIERFLGLALKCGQVNLRVMELLNNAHVKRFGEPRPAEVETGTKAGRAILVTGHDLLDLYELLNQTQDKGINVYTHGEMLPAHGYPELRKFKHLVGNFGNAWQEQRKDFDEFPGAILVTTNCVMIPKDSYRGRLFTTGIAGVEGVRHITGRDFSEVIAAAQKLPALGEAPGKKIATGFHYTAVLCLLDKIVAAVKAGKIRRFFLIGGCDGAKPGRNYYTRLAERVPRDCVVLTVACGKYRFNKMEFGAIDGIPRLIDVGQCNDAYSAIQIALALSKAFGVGVNELPLSVVLSWFEQKAVAILLTLLSLGVKGMRIGPTPPAFLTPGVFKVLQEKFDLKLITTPEQDLQAMLGALPG